MTAKQLMDTLEHELLRSENDVTPFPHDEELTDDELVRKHAAAFARLELGCKAGGARAMSKAYEYTCFMPRPSFERNRRPHIRNVVLRKCVFFYKYAYPC